MEVPPPADAQNTRRGCLNHDSWAFGFPYKVRELILGFQHLFAFFGATVLIPLITGMNPSTALATAGVGTLVFHYLTKLKVPVFLGSSAAFISGIVSTVAAHGPVEGPQYACAGIMIAGLVSLALSFVIYFLGVKRVQYLFPPVVTGSIIIVIGVGLGYLAINDFFGMQDQGGDVNHFYFIHQWVSILIGTFTLCCMIFCMAYMRNFLSFLPVLVGMISGYSLCLILRACTLPTVDFQPIIDQKWINLPYGSYYLKETNPAFGGIFMLPKWDWVAILSIAPLAFVTFMEHIGDITAISRVVGQDFFADPGLHRTMASDAIASFVAGFLGGPEITTYSENTGVLATTKVYDPRILRLSALYAIALGMFGKFGGVIRSIPAPVKGAVSLVLYGMIAACGVSSLIESRVDLSKTRNLIIVSLILTVGLGVNTATYKNGGTGGVMLWFGKTSFALSGLFLCTIVGVVANLVLPMKSGSEIREEKEREEAEKAQSAKELGEKGDNDKSDADASSSSAGATASVGECTPVTVVNENSPASLRRVETPPSPTGGNESPSKNSVDLRVGSVSDTGSSSVSAKVSPVVEIEMEENYE